MRSNPPANGGDAKLTLHLLCELKNGGGITGKISPRAPLPLFRCNAPIFRRCANYRIAIRCHPAKIDAMKKSTSIGIFDSGLGGISVMRELIALLPHEDMIYFGDSGRCPYGEKGNEWIIDRSIAITGFLLSKGAKMIVVACNTATTAAIQTLRERFDLPFVGIEPAIKPAVAITKTKKIGVLATRGALSSAFYEQTRERFARDVEVIDAAGSGLAEAVDRGRADAPETEALLRSYIEPMSEKGVDTIVLGCTHYPFLGGLIRKIAPQMTVIDPSPAVARHALHLLQQRELLSADATGVHDFFTSGDPALMRSFLEAHAIKYNSITFLDEL